MKNRENTALGIGLTAISTTQIFTTMLSSAFTARNIVQEKGDVEGVKTDAYIAAGTSIAFSLGMAWLLRDKWTAIFGIGFTAFFLWTYFERGQLFDS